jgi:hypothetical protein
MEWATDATRFRATSLARAAIVWRRGFRGTPEAQGLRAGTRGRPEMGQALLDKLDRSLGRRSARKKTTGARVPGLAVAPRQATARGSQRRSNWSLAWGTMESNVLESLSGSAGG